MINWTNADKLSSWKKLLSLKGAVSVADELSSANAADRIAKYSIPMGGNLTYNYAAKQVNEQILKTMADPEKQLASIEYWIMGGLNGIRTRILWINIPISVICLMLLLFMHRQSILLSMDEIESKMLGVKVTRVRILLLLLATLAVASVVSITGIISFVGLLAPHCARKLIKSNQVETMILSGILGGGFLMIADVLARSVAQSELPVSVFTSMFGVPFLILLIVRGRVKE